MGRPKGSKNLKTPQKAPSKRSGGVTAKPAGLAVGDKIPYKRPLGGSEQVTIEGIETRVDKISGQGLTKEETVLYLSNGKWMRGTDYIQSLNEETGD